MNKTLVNKILITLAFLFAYRILAYVPVPGVNVDVIKEFFSSNNNNALGLFNMFSGNAAERLSIISLGIMPYITASIIMELLAATFPNLGKMKKERDGMQKYMQIIRYATIIITLIQSIGVSIGLQSLTGRGGEQAIMIDMNLFIAISAVSMLTGTMLLMWIGEQITQRGIGNGISLIIFAGIVSGIPSAISGTINLVNTSEMNFLVVIGILLVILATIGAIIFVEMGERRIPISYSRKVVMQNQNKRIMNYIPIKVNLSGVIPPIFASAILMFPSTILQASTNPYIQAINDFLNPNGYMFNFLTFLFVIFFAYFYASIVFNTKDISENLKRQGGFIPGVRPGENTANYLNEVAGRLTFSGAIYLGLISTLPWVLVKTMGVPFYFGGTSVLIVVSVALDTMRRIEAQIYMNKYQTLSAVGL
ncbi:preprotein translocase subunit SecY [Campylobacter sp. RM9344]|uniref:Protein translocase subunit SecY n=1 Tax=Campylobacter californiensis TaxID=1032243 RepID=A0AAW3ZT59_9BACT|nr:MULTISPECIES: preprotein translocase subunit SecY [unclassified Campylobacter]MBE2985199.1 preprotein translocase subunit SecY [Campylobacter sp. RM6883]MBE2986975.1 preprotein translocase subunit SecY [Campylobacter sp. RM12919]MBE2988620.1 preprotein translocase subunit SecY [Campylobacter sp. RM12920]MBE2995276.1 preprotein translocase subunit SecY [Campylobacter sp. RM6913]MBE3022039.1 preprotein translocase subunit SecY [Campylobacter sp. 7477a]MBE3029918.1 preprotein translocase subu